MTVNFKGITESITLAVLRVLLVFLTLGLGSGCSNSLYHIPKLVRPLLTSSEGFTGIHVIDPESGKEWLRYRADRLFVPASTLKLLTWHRVRASLGERAPAFGYRIRGNAILLRPMGYPYLAYPGKEDSDIRSFLQAFDTLYLDTVNGPDRWAPGWSWEDYPYSYSADRSLLPLYGNRLWVWKTLISTEATGRDTALAEGYRILPIGFEDSLSWTNGSGTPLESVRPRERFRNRFTLQKPLDGDTLSVPFITDSELETRLLSEYIQRPVIPEESPANPMEGYRVYFGLPLDSILRPMLRDSDNFLAEQLLLMDSGFEAGKILDSLSRNTPEIDQSTVRWVDGSGLSRYNLITPDRLTRTLSQLYRADSIYSWRHLLPVDMLRMEEGGFEPIYAKSGSMGGIYNLAGFMRTRRGRWVAFAIMNNNYTLPREALRAKTHNILRKIYASY